MTDDRACSSAHLSPASGRGKAIELSKPTTSRSGTLKLRAKPWVAFSRYLVRNMGTNYYREAHDKAEKEGNGYYAQADEVRGLRTYLIKYSNTGTGRTNFGRTEGCGSPKSTQLVEKQILTGHGSNVYAMSTKLYCGETLTDYSAMNWRQSLTDHKVTNIETCISSIFGSLFRLLSSSTRDTTTFFRPSNLSNTIATR